MLRRGRSGPRPQHEGNEEEDIPAALDRREYPPEFEALWQRYPRKVAKGSALKAWTSACKRATAAEIEAGLERGLPALAAKDTEFIPYLASWLNADRWLDEQPVKSPGEMNGSHSAPDATEVSSQIWQRRIEDWENHRRWSIEWGPCPSEQGCLAPRELLLETGKAHDG